MFVPFIFFWTAGASVPSARGSIVDVQKNAAEIFVDAYNAMPDLDAINDQWLLVQATARAERVGFDQRAYEMRKSRRDALFQQLRDALSEYKNVLKLSHSAFGNDEQLRQATGSEEDPSMLVIRLAWRIGSAEILICQFEMEDELEGLLEEFRKQFIRFAEVSIVLLPMMESTLEDLKQTQIDIVVQNKASQVSTIHAFQKTCEALLVQHAKFRDGCPKMAKAQYEAQLVKLREWHPGITDAMLAFLDDLSISSWANTFPVIT